MKRILSILICFCLLFSLAACSRNYTDWKTISFTADTAAESVENPATFMVPSGWVLSRVDDFWFFASYPIETLADVYQENGEIYLLGWTNRTEPIHAVSEIFPDVTLPDDQAIFSMGMENGAIYGQEKYLVDEEIWTKYYVSLKSYDVYELKLIDWQDRCGKQMMKNIARSYMVEVPETVE